MKLFLIGFLVGFLIGGILFSLLIGSANVYEWIKVRRENYKNRRRGKRGGK